MYHVSSFFNSHNHFLSASLYAHLTLKDDIEAMILNLVTSGVKFSNIITAVRNATGQTLSTYQLKNLCKRMSIKTLKCESEDLIEYVNAHHGLAVPIEDPEGDFIRRNGVATFNQKELKNLEKYGDFVAINTSFAPMISHLSIIPITVVNSQRKILSGGLIFASSNSRNTFKYILKLLTTVLPCKSIIQTICSDDDPGLDAAFEGLYVSNNPDEQEAKEKVLSLRRDICFWHKSSNFQRFLNTLNLSPEIKESCMNLFHQIGTSRDKEHVMNCIEILRTINDSIKDYLDRNVLPKFDFISKVGLKDSFTLGYISSSIAESANNRIKSYIYGRALTLLEMRMAMDSIIEGQRANEQYLKGRKRNKEQDCRIVNLLVTRNISTKIAQAIVGSMQKADSRLIITKEDQKYLVTDEIRDKQGNLQYTEHFTIEKGHCSCYKFEQC
ncbi:hypothetical protein M9Y10_028651 [Tritrichomonas musculus]|uniref:MULE transposase domain-containing protein n=1 Tax=Tritrichomonas musculus TaxID=1915356 RepID=A0ABR2KJY5_9EUKA